MFLPPGCLGPRARRAAVGAAAVSLTALGLPAIAAAPASAAAPTTPFVSELHYDNAGTDSGEFVEVQLPAGTSSAGLSVVLYNGGTGATYDTDALPAVTAPADAPAVAVVDYPANGVQNGSPDAVALVRGGEVLEFLSYEGTFAATNGPAAGRTSTDIGVSEAGTEPAGQSLSRTVTADGTSTWSGPAAATRGAVNAPAATPQPPAPGRAVEIGAVQGTGATTPLAGQQVTVTGVVVGDTPGLSGFYLQDRDGDGDPATSDGVFVFSAAAVDLGDTVTVTGQAQEFGGQTQVRASGVAVVAEGGASDLPAPAALDLPADAAARERLEGMRVVPADRLTVSEVFDLTSFGELTLSEGGVLVQPTELARPGAGAQAIAEENARRSIVLDDAVSARASVTARPYLSPTTPVRVGDEVSFTEPLVLGYGFDAWRLQPADGTADGVFAPQDTRPQAPEAVGGDVQVGAFNVLNYFLTLGGAGRGATSQAELEEQAGKIVPAIRALGADVVTLMEIEDTASTGRNPGNADLALEDLVRRLNTAAGSQEWAYVPMPAELYAVDRDVIRNAIIYKQDVVQPVGEPVGLVDETVWSNAREPIAQTFVKDGDAFTVVADHFKSKGGTGTGDNADTGQGSFNGDRVRQAQSLAGFLARLRESTGDADVVALGDFNAYTQEDPIEVLRTDAGLVDLGERFDAGRYSYVFDALSGSLDHALASAELTAKVTDATHWNINSVESFAYQYTGDPALYAPNPYRSSDHDPVVFGIDLDERCQGLVPTIRGTAGDDVLKGTNGRDVVVGLGGNDVITGGNGDDVLCGGDGDDRISGGNGDDVLVGGTGKDVLNGDNGSDRLLGGAGVDVLDQGRGQGVEDPEGPWS
ncbi:ExeM/NucH family extracellular endonuclease [Kineococcus radiotolerans]|uniref:Endonuclease/exonuclease/phosphatase n=1 Tax=Kineococcus radiotolerans (strain ATCC BAA-149 / DSM 14245 / SRS30216) TaxID=266940 RepID=A6WE39_KINRD|nr:ExeM/NucH family extracellular endonuclease [Kineococcus radiotolerans]ABS05078.1 Endonuclease/exonuclease/phosphatase [Kineococcus radiotolerans SRS30216 = ATCC BAA-149]